MNVWEMSEEAKGLRPGCELRKRRECTSRMVGSDQNLVLSLAFLVYRIVLRYRRVSRVQTCLWTDSQIVLFIV